MKLIGLGAGGHAKVVIDIIKLIGKYEIIGLLDAQKQSKDWYDIPILGDDELLPELHQQGVQHCFIGAGSIGNIQIREALFEKAKQADFEVITAIHPQSIISPSAQIGEGATIMAGSIINASAQLGCNVIVNTGAIIEHDCQIQDHVHVATGACLAGEVRVGKSSHIGAGVSILQGIVIGERSIVGAGAAVVKDVPDHVVVAGVPAHTIRKIKNH